MYWPPAVSFALPISTCLPLWDSSPSAVSLPHNQLPPALPYPTLPTLPPLTHPLTPPYLTTTHARRAMRDFLRQLPHYYQETADTLQLSLIKLATVDANVTRRDRPSPPPLLFPQPPLPPLDHVHAKPSSPIQWPAIPTTPFQHPTSMEWGLIRHPRRGSANLRQYHCQ